jgi:RHS repeat-associated protein
MVLTVPLLSAGASHLARRFASLALLVLSATIAIGQVATGSYPYGTFDSKGFDTINVGNLNAHLSIPVLQKPGRGMSFSYALGYDSSIWSMTTGSWQPAQNWGWLAQTVVPTGYVTYSTVSVNCDWPLPKRGSYNTYSGWVYHDPFGVSHSFNGYLEYDPTGCDSTVTSFSSTATDGSGLTLYVAGTRGIPNGKQTITTRNGVTTTAPVGNSAVGSTITDTNGNQISVSAAGVFTDTTGVNVLTVAGEAPGPVTLTYPTTTGTTAYTMKYGSYTVKTNFGCSGINEYSATGVSLVSEIDLPDTSKYTFTYETTPNNSSAVTGRITSVMLPSGGEIVYTYSGGSNGIECTDGSTAGLTRVLNAYSGSAASTLTYTRTAGTSTSTTAVTDGLGNHSAYTFVKEGNQAQYYETSRAIYQGAASGTPLLVRNTCYNGATAPCTTAAFTLPVTQIDTWETLNGIETHGATAKYNASGMQTESDAYDYGGATARGALLRKESWTYYASVPNFPTSDMVYDGSGILAGETTYTYDVTGTTASTACAPGTTGSSCVPQHVAVSGSLGNLDGMSQYVNSTTAYSSVDAYEDTGSLLSVSSTNGTVTTYTYDNTFTYPTTITPPTPSSGISLQSAATYDTANTGLALTTTDLNSKTTIIASYDDMLRPTKITYPDGGQDTWSYSPTTVATTRLQSSGTSSYNETQYDGYGRPSRSEVANGQSGNYYYQQDTCYDANGNAAFTSYAYQGTGFSAIKVCSGAGDTGTYDALGRLTKLVRANNETLTITYLGRAKTVADENGVTRISQTDGLGRTTIVCEISANTLLGVSPTSCGTDISGMGFVTSYAYALATPTTTITQGAQTRVFQSDWLGRPTLVQEPESGTTTYSYAYGGLVVTRQRPTANQTSSSVLTTTTTQYDSLGRVVSITYSDGTPAKTFAYDKSAGTSFSDLTQTYLKGRLSLASVPTAGTAYSYDAMGRTSYLDECLPSGCGTVTDNHQLHYTYDLAGNLLTSTDGSAIGSTYTVSPAGEVLSLTSSLSDSTDPAHIVSIAQYGPNGPLSYSLGNGLAGAYSYDALGRLNGGTVSASGTQVYGFTNGWKGQQLTGSGDSVLGQGSTYGYDEFNRLASRTVNSGTGPNYAWAYDRYGNRLSQTMTGGTGSGLTSSLSVNSANNQVTGYTYDAAGNMTNDGFHTYTYDADGHITAVDGGQTASYVYNALNQRVRAMVGTTATEYVFSAGGQRVSEWNGATLAQIKGKYYWGTRPVAYYSGNATHFEHPDWMGTERMRTTYNSALSPAYAVEGSFTSLPFGDGLSAYGTDTTHYATLDSDQESGTAHAQFRQYSSAQGRWLSPDPYGGSYSFHNPQSFNRYSYVLDNPLTLTDPSGLVCSITVFGVNNNQGEYGTNGAIYPYSGEGLLGALGSIFSQSLFGANSATMQVSNAINQNSSEPGGIALIGFSGGAQAISTAIQSRLVHSSTISSITYLSPGLGLGGSLASVGNTAAFSGSGFLDGLATLNARISGATLTSTGCSGHNYTCEINSAQVQQRVSAIPPCPTSKGGAAMGGNSLAWFLYILGPNQPDGNGNGNGNNGDSGPGSGWCPDCSDPVLIPRGTDSTD